MAVLCCERERERNGESKDGEGSRVPLELTPSEEGGMATFCLTVAGSYTMHVNLRRKPLPGSPFKAEVIPDTACAAASCIEDVLGVGSRRLVVGEQSAFVLQTLGRHGNACVAEGAHVRASCSAAASRSSSTATPAPARCSVVDRRDGSYLVRVACFHRAAPTCSSCCLTATTCVARRSLSAPPPPRRSALR